MPNVETYNICNVEEDFNELALSNAQGISLPDEILLEVLSYVRDTAGSQQTLWSCCLISRQWYSCAVPFLYEHPNLYGKNFEPFAATICPSVNLHIRKSPLAEYVRGLDMGRLVHQGSKSLTARILGRVKGGLEEFVAPQASFGINCFAALSKCSKLRLVDLSLIVETIPLDSLLRCLTHLLNLCILYFPRLSDSEIELELAQWSWPPNLRELWITNGGVPDSFLHNVSGLPSTLDTLAIQRCAKVTSQSLRRLPEKLSSQLRVLRISELPRLSWTSLDGVLARCPNLKQLSVPINNITQAFFDDPSDLEYLEITISNGAGGEHEVVPVDVCFAISDNLLPNLRGVCYPGTILSQSEEFRKEFDTLDCLLRERLDADEPTECAFKENRMTMNLTQMVEENLIGAWQWYPQYEARHELRHH
ncbi:MAG: hypothetical protein Q9157_000711 [Trypethelium eluteriae]